MTARRKQRACGKCGENLRRKRTDSNVKNNATMKKIIKKMFAIIKNKL